MNAEFTDQWRRNKDAFVRTGDARFNQVFGYEGILREAVNGALKKFGVTTLVIGEIPEDSKSLSRFGFEEFVSDSVVVLHYLEYAAGGGVEGY